MLYSGKRDNEIPAMADAHMILQYVPYNPKLPKPEACAMFVWRALVRLASRTLPLLGCSTRAAQAKLGVNAPVQISDRRWDALEVEVDCVTTRCTSEWLGREAPRTSHGFFLS